MNTNTTATSLPLLALLAGIGLALNPLHAADLTWDASGSNPASPQDGSGNWDTSNPNWSDFSTDSIWNNAAADNAIFGTGAALASGCTVTVTEPITVGNLTFNYTGANNYIIGVASPAQTITFVGSPTVTVATSGAYIQEKSPLAGSGFTKAGLGAFQIGSDNPAFSNPISISGGTLQLGINTTAGSLGTAPIVNDGIFIIRRTSSSFVCSNAVSGIGQVQFQLNSSSGISVSPNSPWTYTGATTLLPTAANVAGGKVFLSGNDGLSPFTALTLSSNLASLVTLDLKGFNQTVASLASTCGPANAVITNSSPTDATLTVSNGTTSTATFTYNGLLAGNLILQKGGSNVLVLNAANTYTNQTVVSGGTLRVGNSAALGTTVGGTTVNASSGANFLGTVLELGSVAVGNEPLTLAGGTTGGNRTTLRTTNNAVASWAGNIAVTGNQLVQITAQGAASQITISGKITGSASPLWFRGAGVGNLNGNVDMGSSPVATLDGGIWNLNTASNVWGTTTIWGTLLMGANYALPSSTRLALGGSPVGTGVLQLNGTTQTIQALLLNNGTSPTNKIINGSVTPATLILANDSGTNYSFNGNLGGSDANENNFALIKTGSARQTLSGINTYSGATTINGGALIIDGSLDAASAVSVATSGTLGGSGVVNGTVTVDANGTVAPGSSALDTLTINNNLTLNAGAQAFFRLNSTNSTEINDALVVTGIQNITASTITVSNVGPALAVGDSFQLLSQPSSGFTTANLPSGYTWTNRLALDGTIKVLALASTNPDPATLTYSAGSSRLVLDWPTGQGWQLQAQTNALGTGLTTNWFNVTGATPPYTNDVNPVNPSVFYRLVYP